MKLQVVMILGLLFTGNVQAQMNNNQHHQNQQRIQNQNHRAEQHRQGYMNSQQQMQQPPQPTGYWETTWGAIAPSPVGGVVGAAVGAKSKKEAERLALKDCEAKGGGRARLESPITTSVA
ncbi:DUF4189 domain-containing protein [Lysobacter alkalisoli]|uniref:DUF4189 domain-containing protein n=1 Tax=Marilutibacter alkalisoli TaxID=2591633 RepID=A0A514BVB9_9GAMM|nr:DUF4189 domain-containing protein [Lysobacter alkalisoli]QDH71348.1 DUF4189 domain-containing protein [Lysobacter alkalisoli]